MELATGQIVRVRSRQYLVEQVSPSPHPRHSTLVHLSCLEDDAQGELLEVLWEREVDAQIVGASAWDTVASRGFDAPRLFSAYLHTLRWNCVTSTNARLFQAPYRAGIEVKAYQLEPLRGPLRDWLGAFASASLFILDEAHNAAPASGARYAIDSKLTRSVRDLAPRFEHKLFLSATPHNGHSNSFSALLEILDPQKFCRGVAVHPKLRDAVMVRRLKSGAGGENSAHSSRARQSFAGGRKAPRSDDERRDPPR